MRSRPRMNIMSLFDSEHVACSRFGPFCQNNVAGQAPESATSYVNGTVVSLEYGRLTT